MNEIKNLLLIGLSVALIASLGFLGYQYQTKDIVPKGKIEQLEDEKLNINFDDLTPSEQNNYISKSDYFEDLSTIEQEKIQLQRQIEELSSENKKDLLSKTAIVQKELDEKIIKGEEYPLEVKTNTKKGKKYKTYTCKSFTKGSIVVPKGCEKSLYQFIDRYKEDAKEFEIIGMVDGTEFKLIQNLEDVYGASKVKVVKKYVQIGLSRQRVIETTWLVREYIKNNIPIDSVNYTVYSNNKRGFVVRAYF